MCVCVKGGKEKDIQLAGLPCVELYELYQKSQYPLVPRGHIHRGVSLDVPCNSKVKEKEKRGFLVRILGHLDIFTPFL